MKIAFLGLGIMGSRMAANLLAANHHLTVWNRTAEKAASLVEQGATLVHSPADAVDGAEVVITMLAEPRVVQDVAFGEHGFAERLTKNQVWIDSSTVDPTFAKTLGAYAHKHGYQFLDAPVAGTKGPAETGQLLFLVGGDEDTFYRCHPLFDAMGKKAIYLGAVGQGASMKMLINGLLAQSMLAFAETVHLGSSLGLPQSTIFDVLLATPVTAPFLSAIRPKTEGADHSVNFPLKHMRKDLHLAALAAYEQGVAMAGLNAAKEVFTAAQARGFGDEDFTSIFRWLAKG